MSGVERSFSRRKLLGGLGATALAIALGSTPTPGARAQQEDEIQRRHLIPSPAAARSYRALQVQPVSSYFNTQSEYDYKLSCLEPVVAGTNISIRRVHTLGIFLIPPRRLPNGSLEYPQAGIDVARSSYYQELFLRRRRASSKLYSDALGLTMEEALLPNLGPDIPGYLKLSKPLKEYPHPNMLNGIDVNQIQDEIIDRLFSRIRDLVPVDSYLRFASAVTTGWTAPASENPGNRGGVVKVPSTEVRVGTMLNEENTLSDNYHPNIEALATMSKAHEGGHALGLSHIYTDSGEIMNDQTLYDGNSKHLSRSSAGLICGPRQSRRQLISLITR